MGTDRYNDDPLIGGEKDILVFLQHTKAQEMAGKDGHPASKSWKATMCLKGRDRKLV